MTAARLLAGCCSLSREPWEPCTTRSESAAFISRSATPSEATPASRRPRSGRSGTCWARCASASSPRRFRGIAGRPCASAPGVGDRTLAPTRFPAGAHQAILGPACRLAPAVTLQRWQKTFSGSDHLSACAPAAGGHAPAAAHYSHFSKRWRGGPIRIAVNTFSPPRLSALNATLSPSRTSTNASDLRSVTKRPKVQRNTGWDSGMGVHRAPWITPS